MQINRIAGLGDKTCLEYIDLPERPERLEPAPAPIVNGPAGDIIRAHTGSDRVWTHQAKALRLLEAGQNPVVATGTASGKSLIFQAWTFHNLKLNPDATAIVFDPLRALAEDQTQSWRRLAESLDLPPGAIAKIDGTVPIGEREDRLADASVVIMTPDVCHAWLMRNMSSRAVQKFIANLVTLALDEAHVYDSVFGSNAAYLFRRLVTAQKQLSGNSLPCRIIAATATISNPAQHLERLTGLPFVEVAEADNGAQIHPRRLMHIDGSYEDDLITIVRHALSLEEKFIVFCDSRQGVERVARQVGRPDQVAPYRNGYEANDRVNIENALRYGSLRGVVSTSALELGINIPGLTLGVNFKIPNSRKSFRQRLGRIGRHGPGAFAVVADRNAFKEFGDNLQSYYESSVEPSLLYLDNPYVQFTNAQCLAKETGIRATDDQVVAWPDGFARMTEYALKGDWPKKYAILGRAGLRNPHINHPLRSIAEDELNLVSQDNGSRLGTIKLSHALRETYPMGHYIHRGRSYQAQHWNREGRYGKTEIPLQEVPFHEKTEPVISKEIEVRGIVNGNVAVHRDPARGYAAEVNARVTERTLGYNYGKVTETYSPDEQPVRTFDTTGVLLRIEDSWAQWKPPRDTLSYDLKRLTCYDQSIAAWDIDHSSEIINIASKANPEGQNVPNAIIVFDTTAGSLRLSEALFKNLAGYAGRLTKAVELDGENVAPEVVRELNEWVSGLSWPEPAKTAEEAGPGTPAA